MDFVVLTLFPELMDSFFSHGMISRGIEKKLMTGKSIHIRDFSTDRTSIRLQTRIFPHCGSVPVRMMIRGSLFIKNSGRKYIIRLKMNMTPPGAWRD